MAGCGKCADIDKIESCKTAIVAVAALQKMVHDFWQENPCGSGLVGDLIDKSESDYRDFFTRYDEYRYSKEPHIRDNLCDIDFDGKTVLEIGVGNGADAEQIVRSGAHFSGIDITEESVERTRTRFDLKKLPFNQLVRSSALDIPFEDDSFDIVFSHGVLHHIPEVRRAADEIHRVLRPDGKLIVMLYAKWSLHYLLSISVLRRIGVVLIYLFGLRSHPSAEVVCNEVRKKGLFNYLRMKNFLHANTDGPLNPYTKVYSLDDVRRDFPDFTIVGSHNHFMYSPPVDFSWLPLEKYLGWHLWIEMKPNQKESALSA